MPRRRSNKPRFIPIAVSLLLHGVLIGALVWWGYSSYSRPTAPAPKPQVPIKLVHAERGEDESPVVDEQEVAQKITKGVGEFQRRPIEENLKTLVNNAAWLESRSTEQSVEQIAAVLRRSLNAPKRAYAPVENPPAGPFEMRSMLPYATEKQTSEDGIERTVFTWVDRDGRTMTNTRRKGTDKAGKAVVYQGVFQPNGELFEVELPQDPSLEAYYTAIEKGTSTPLMKKLFQEGLLPALESYRQSQAAKEQPNPPAASNGQTR